MDDRADDDLGNFAGHDLATEAELRQKEKEARKRKKKKEKKRREREKAWQESERAGAGRGAGSLHAHALDMLGAGDVGSGGDDDDFSSPLNSGRGPSDGGLDGLYLRALTPCAQRVDAPSRPCVVCVLRRLIHTR
jgi:hypothetical protein